MQNAGKSGFAIKLQEVDISEQSMSILESRDRISQLGSIIKGSILENGMAGGVQEEPEYIQFLESGRNTMANVTMQTA